MKIQCVKIQTAGSAPVRKETASKKQALMWPRGRVRWWEMKLMVDKGFPDGSVVKNLPANVRDTGSIPGSGRSPGEGNGNPVPYSRQGNRIDRGAWQVCGVTKSQTQLNRHTHTQGQPPCGTGLHTRDPPKERSQNRRVWGYFTMIGGFVCYKWLFQWQDSTVCTFAYTTQGLEVGTCNIC